MFTMLSKNTRLEYNKPRAVLFQIKVEQYEEGFIGRLIDINEEKKVVLTTYFRNDDNNKEKYNKTFCELLMLIDSITYIDNNKDKLLLSFFPPPQMVVSKEFPLNIYVYCNSTKAISMLHNDKLLNEFLKHNRHYSLLLRLMYRWYKTLAYGVIKELASEYIYVTFEYGERRRKRSNVKKYSSISKTKLSYFSY